MAITRLSIDGYGSRRAGSFSGKQAVVTSSSSGMHRLANASRQAAKSAYQSIDWTSPVFGEPPKPEISATPKTEAKVERTAQLDLTQVDLSQEQNELSAIDGEIQSLLRDVISHEGTIAELEAIEKSIRETDRRLLEAEQLNAESLRMRKLALLLLLSAA